MTTSNLTVDTFLALAETFFDNDGTPKPFRLRAKGSTQDDPLDEYIAGILSSKLGGVTCQRSGPLVSPDLVLYRPEQCENALRSVLADDLTRIVALEVKKLERQASGQVARPTGLDYNTTPPCNLVRVYDGAGKFLDIRAFYLFVCQERRNDEYIISALALCDGGVINKDFDLYLRITGQRLKGVGLGTYGEGVDRQRPMLLFPNPLGAAQFDYARTLITEANLHGITPALGLIYEIGRTIAEGSQEPATFYAYRQQHEIPAGWEAVRLLDPFPRPLARQEATQARGKFRLPIKVMED